MDSKTNEQQQARALYFQTDMSQKEISQRIGINRKTLFTWIKQGHWLRAKRSVASAPIFLSEQYYTQLAMINKAIAEREERPYPTREEAEIIRKLSITLRHLPANNRASDAINVFELFIDKLTKTDLDLAKTIMPHMDEHVKYLYERSEGNTLVKDTYTEDADDREYNEWLREQRNNTSAPTEQPVAAEKVKEEKSTETNNIPMPATPVQSKATPEAEKPQEAKNGVTNGVTPETPKLPPNVVYMLDRQKEIMGRGFPNGVRDRQYTVDEINAEIAELNADPRYVLGEKEYREIRRRA